MKAHLAISALCLSVCLVAAASAQAPPKTASPEEVLRNITVVGDDGSGNNLPPLPKIGVLPSLSSDRADVVMHAVVRRDLDLCGEFEVIPDKNAPDGLYLETSPVDIDAWKNKGAEAVVKVNGKTLPDGKVELTGIAYLTDVGDKPVYNTTIVVGKGDTRFASHRITDALVGALTGTDSAFYSQMAFIYGVGKQKRVYIIDADGHDPKPVSSDGKATPRTPVFAPDHTLYFPLSVRRRPYALYSNRATKPVGVKPNGSVYGLAYNRKGDEIAVSIGQGPDIRLFRGPDFQNLKVASKNKLAMFPAWSPTGKLAFAGESKWGPRIYVDDKAVSPAGLPATAPSFCRHPDGIRLIYMGGWREKFDLISTTPQGSNTVRITGGRGKNQYPACSPDGRLVAFFSSRKTGEGPGLYIMRVDGRRPKKVSSLLGSHLTWARMPKK
ncbi:MAG: tolB protein [Myxococcota bacterium]